MVHIILCKVLVKKGHKVIKFLTAKGKVYRINVIADKRN